MIAAVTDEDVLQVTAAKANLEWPRVWCEPIERVERKLLVSGLVIGIPFFQFSAVFPIMPAYRFESSRALSLLVSAVSVL